MRLARHRASGRSAGERDTFVIGNVLGQLPSSDFHGSGEIVLTKERNHRAASVARASVIDDGLEPVTDFHAIFAVVGSEEQNHTGVLLFCADAEMFEEIDSVVFYRAIVEGTHSDDGELRAGFLFKFAAQSLQPLASAGRDYAGKIGNVPGRDDSLDIVRERGRECEQKHQGADRKPQQAERIYEGQNEFQIRASLRIWRWAARDKHRGFWKKEQGASRQRPPWICNVKMDIAKQENEDRSRNCSSEQVT